MPSALYYRNRPAKYICDVVMKRIPGRFLGDALSPQRRIVLPFQNPADVYGFTARS
jgi:hypothetical protein